MYQRSVRTASRWLLMMAMITVATGSAKAQKSVWEKGAQLQVVSEIGAGEGPAWNPAVGLVSSFGSVYLHDVENPNRDTPQIYIKDLGTNGLLWDAEGQMLSGLALVRFVVSEVKARTV